MWLRFKLWRARSRARRLADWLSTVYDAADCGQAVLEEICPSVYRVRIELGILLRYIRIKQAQT